MNLPLHHAATLLVIKYFVVCVCVCVYVYVQPLKWVYQCVRRPMID